MMKIFHFRNHLVLCAKYCSIYIFTHFNFIGYLLLIFNLIWHIFVKNGSKVLFVIIYAFLSLETVDAFYKNIYCHKKNLLLKLLYFNVLLPHNIPRLMSFYWMIGRNFMLKLLNWNMKCHIPVIPLQCW